MSAASARETCDWKTFDQPPKGLQRHHLAGTHRRPVARSACRLRALENDCYAILSLASRWNVFAGVQSASRTSRFPRTYRLGNALRRQHRGSRTSACRWWKKGAPRALGRSRGGFGTKIHLRTDGKGNPIFFTLTGGEKHDTPQTLKLVDHGHIKRGGRGRPRLRPKRLAGDKGYDSDAVRAGLRTRGIEPIIPSRSNRKCPVLFDRRRYRDRNVIERCFNRLKHWRRVATRYEKLAANYAAVVIVAATVHFLKLLL